MKGLFPSCGGPFSFQKTFKVIPGHFLGKAVLITKIAYGLLKPFY